MWKQKGPACKPPLAKAKTLRKKKIKARVGAADVVATAAAAAALAPRRRVKADPPPPPPPCAAAATI